MTAQADFGGACLRLQQNFGLVIGRVDAKPFVAFERLKRRLRQWRSGGRPSVPQTPEGAAAARRYWCPVHGENPPAWRAVGSPVVRCDERAGAQACGRELMVARYDDRGVFMGFIGAERG